MNFLRVTYVRLDCSHKVHLFIICVSVQVIQNNKRYQRDLNYCIFSRGVPSAYTITELELTTRTV